jgi:aldose 1-epimerase
LAPYFPKRAGCRIAFSATGRWEMGPDKLPTHCSASPGLQMACADLTIDHCFEGWPGEVVMEDAQLRTRLRANLKRLAGLHPCRTRVLWPSSR